MTTRRHFIQATAGAALAAQAARAQRTISANDNVQIGIIGLGGMGTGDVESSLAVGGTKLVAAADVYDGRLIHAKERFGNDVFTTRDYEELLARPEIDAVIIATPDHWHSRVSIDAMNAGKDVYCEKPMVQHLDDAPGVIAAQKKTGRIMQVGSQRVSSIVYKKAQDLLRQGVIGEFNMVEAWWDRNSAIGAWQYSIPPDASETTIDWPRFEGRAPKARVRRQACIPLAQLPRLWNRRRGRSVRSPVQRHALCHRGHGADARVCHRAERGSGKMAAMFPIYCWGFTTIRKPRIIRRSISPCA